MRIIHVLPGQVMFLRLITFSRVEGWSIFLNFRRYEFHILFEFGLILGLGFGYSLGEGAICVLPGIIMTMVLQAKQPDHFKTREEYIYEQMQS